LSGEGSLSLIAVLDSQPYVITSEWTHHSSPTMSFSMSYRDTFAFLGDTLSVRLDGIPSGQFATVQAAGIPFNWVGATPLADSAGVINGKVILPESLPMGDYPITALTSGMPDAVCTDTLRVRSFFRIESEELTISSWQGASRDIRWAPPYNLPGYVESWGKNLCRRLIGRQVGDQITLTFYLPIGGEFRANYFFAKTGYGVIANTYIDSSADLQSVDTYQPGLAWRWTRSDTIRGTWRALNAGMHLLKFEIAGRNPQASDWHLVMDQIVMEWRPFVPPPYPPAAVTDLVISTIPAGVQLAWQPVTEDVQGNPIELFAYDVYTSQQSDGDFLLYGSVPAIDTIFVDTVAEDDSL
jgi:hypothetical protein